MNTEEKNDVGCSVQLIDDERGNRLNRTGQEAQMSCAARVVLLFAMLAAPFCAPAQASDYEVGSSATRRDRWNASPPCSRAMQKPPSGS
jgi:hypothetical protein